MWRFGVVAVVVGLVVVLSTPVRRMVVGAVAVRLVFSISSAQAS
jgi:hypothetical protein